jgi:hypothetical protein
MRKHLPTIFFACTLCIALIGLSACWKDGPKKPKGIVAIVYADLTKSINKEIAERQKENIGELFKKLPWNTKFFLFSIDRGSSQPTIYEFTPKITIVTDTKEEMAAKKDPENNQTAKETTEYEKLNSSLNSYHAAIASQQGMVSCISNKLNFLLDRVRDKTESFPEHEIRVFFYSDMIEQCENSFDGKPLNLKRVANDKEEAKYLQDIQARIEQNFEPANNLNSMGTKIYIIRTSQDDKQNLKTLTAIWDSFFKKLGLATEDIDWTNSNEPYFWAFPATPRPKT